MDDFDWRQPEVPDDGFTLRVLAALPAQSRARSWLDDAQSPLAAAAVAAAAILQLAPSGQALLVPLVQLCTVLAIPALVGFAAVSLTTALRD